MNKVIFPPVHNADEHGLVALGGELDRDTLWAAYQAGIFPWPMNEKGPIPWFSPDPRGMLFIEDIHIPKSFKKFLKRCNYSVTFNQNFSQVIRECASMRRKDQPSTWITKRLIEGYENLFNDGSAYSVEVWNEHKELIGGVYGVCMGEFISGESMFSKEINASKVGLFHLLQKLEEKEIRFLDTQMVTSVVESFGGVYVERPDFIELINELDWSLKREDIF